MDKNNNKKISTPTLKILSSSDKKIWGLAVEEWQIRAFKKSGASIANDACQNSVTLFIKAGWVFSTPLISALCARNGIALVSEGQIAAAHIHDDINADKAQTALLNNDIKTLQSLGLVIQSPEDLAGAYNEVLRKREIPFAYSLETTERRFVEQKLFDSSYKGITDFVTKYFWPRPAFHVTRFCAALKMTPNMVTGLSFVMVLAAFFFFLRGDWILGMASAWFMTFLDTVDGKLARTTMQSSKWGHVFDHGIDLIHPPFWYFAWYVGLGVNSLGANGTERPEWLLPCFIAIFIGYWIDRIVEGLFILKFKFHIHMWKPIDSFVRIYTARRNPNTFIFMMALLFLPFFLKAGFIGYALVTLWTWACIGFHIIRLLQAYFAKKPVLSWMTS